MNMFTRKQAGLSLIEMMTTLLIGCFMIMGITQFYIDNRSSYLFQLSQAGNLNKSRYAAQVLEETLSRAGYRTLPWVSLENSFPAVGSTSGCPAFAAGQTVAKNSAGTGVCVRYQTATDADGSERDCLGSTVADSTDVVLNLNYDSSEGQLTCTDGSNSAVLVSDIAGFVVSDIPDSSADSQSVRFAMLLNNGTDLGDDVDNDVLARWNLLTGQSLSTDGASSQAYQIAQGSVALRNLMQ